MCAWETLIAAIYIYIYIFSYVLKVLELRALYIVRPCVRPSVRAFLPRYPNFVHRLRTLAMVPSPLCSRLHDFEICLNKKLCFRALDAQSVRVRHINLLHLAWEWDAKWPFPAFLLPPATSCLTPHSSSLLSPRLPPPTPCLGAFTCVWAWAHVPLVFLYFSLFFSTFLYFSSLILYFFF